MIRRKGWTGHLFAALLLALVAWQTATHVAGAASRHAPGMLPLRGFGYAALTLLCFSLSLGPLARLWPRTLGGLLPWRRATGIWTAVAAALHLLFVLQYLKLYRRTDLKSVFFQSPEPYGMSIPQAASDRWFPDISPTGIAIWVGALGLVWLLVMALTSNDPAQRWLGQSSWKLLHQGVYTVFVLVLLHFALVSLAPLKGSPERISAFWYLVGAVVLLQLAGFIRTVRSRRRDSRAPGQRS